VATEAIGALLEATLEPGDRVCLEGKQPEAGRLPGPGARPGRPAASARPAHGAVGARPAGAPGRLRDRHREPAGLQLLGPQGARLAKLVAAGGIQIGAIHTYLELFARYFVDLTPKVALIAAQAADADGNLYTGPNTEDTPAIVEATAFSGGIVIAQVNELVDGTSTTLPRIDIPAGWVDFVVQAPRPNVIEPLFTRDPAQISEIQVLMAMMAIKGIYAEYGVQRLNHGIGFDTAAIELLLPTYGEALGLKGKICRHWALNPHPALIPAIEAGWVESIHSFGSELGWRTTSAPARTCSSPAPTAACAATARSARPPATTPATCSSARRCRSTWTATAPPRRSGASPASAARRTWGPTRAAAATRARRG
jgi:malonate decarboxylase alpha subunit